MYTEILLLGICLQNSYLYRTSHCEHLSCYTMALLSWQRKNDKYFLYETDGWIASTEIYGTERVYRYVHLRICCPRSGLGAASETNNI